jgi:hypothetical protein
MKKISISIITFVLAYIFCFASLTAQNESSNPKRIRRSESFLGIHFDFHAGADCTEIGKNVDRAMVEYILDTVKPDYVQTDCKGHPGFTSYPTKVGNPAPGFVRDPLKIWREVTAERGVSLYMHYSGVWDTEALVHRPEWARINEKGERDKDLTSVYGRYADELLIPQLKELSDVYGVDGVWIDGECWAVARDYNKNTIKAFQKETGIREVPRKPEDPNWFEWTEFNRKGFLSYVDHYVTELHKHNPDFQICSNWAYSSTMPQQVNIDVDFISGDYKPLDSVRTARFEGRCMVHQGKPWDLMAWHFTRTGGSYSTKTIPQLSQEASVVLSLGGGFQAYFPQNRDGSVKKWQMELMGETAKFCRARQNVCHRAEPVPQIGLIYSGKAFYRNIPDLFGSWTIAAHEPLQGILHSLLDSQNTVDIVMEHHLTDRMQDYPLLVYPEWDYVDPAFKAELLEYVHNGGNLLVIGPESAALFEDELGITLIGEPKEKMNGLGHDGWIAGINSFSQEVTIRSNTRSFGKLYNNNDIENYNMPAASICKYGKGNIAGIYLDMGRSYLSGSHTVSRDFLDSLVRELFPDPVVEVTGSNYVDVTVNRIDGKLAVNLVNTSGPHANDRVYVYDEIPKTGPLTVSIRSKKRPEKITLEPSGRMLSYKYNDGIIALTLPELEIHDIIVVE